MSTALELFPAVLVFVRAPNNGDNFALSRQRNRSANGTSVFFRDLDNARNCCVHKAMVIAPKFNPDELFRTSHLNLLQRFRVCLFLDLKKDDSQPPILYQDKPLVNSFFELYTKYMKKFNKTVLCIIDGLGVRAESEGNAWKIAPMANLDRAIADFPSTTLVASGHEVGLADSGDAGNSEVGHNAIGAGRRIKQGLALLNDVFNNGEIFKTKTWQELSERAKGSKLNIITLLSDGRVHSDIAHLYRVLEQCAKEKIPVAIHALADGRDVATQSILTYIEKTNEFIKKIGTNAKIATVAGRATHFMDRYESNIPAMTAGFNLISSSPNHPVTLHAKGNFSVAEEIEKTYSENPTMTDESLPGFVLEPNMLVNNGDAMLLLNYRGDRAVQTCAMFEKGKYLTPEQFDRIKDCLFVGVLQYDTELGIPAKFLCPPPKIEHGLTWHLCNLGVRQFTVAETVKFGHMTYFFNGNRSLPFDKELETWIEIKSHDVNGAFNKVPQMRAREITDAIMANLGEFDFLKLNLSNPDMVGHTADFPAVVEACRVVDECLGNLIKACKGAGVNLIITADHGNAEQMFEKDGKPKSSHTNNPVPFVVLPSRGAPTAIRQGTFGLTNIASTVCKLLGVPTLEEFNESIV